MANPIEFYFDFSSPYGYLAATQLRKIAAKHQREIAWKSFLLGATFKITGSGPLPTLPMKGPYSVRDMSRTARFFDVPFRMPTTFPIATQAPARMVYWVTDSAPDKTEAAVLALYRAFFVDDKNISEAPVAAAALAAIGLDADKATAAAGDQAMKDRLKQETEQAIARGVFGSPYVFVDGEPFWGSDRLEQVDRWLATGGF